MPHKKKPGAAGKGFVLGEAAEHKRPAGPTEHERNIGRLYGPRLVKKASAFVTALDYRSIIASAGQEHALSVILSRIDNFIIDNMPIYESLKVNAKKNKIHEQLLTARITNIVAARKFRKQLNFDKREIQAIIAKAGKTLMDPEVRIQDKPGIAVKLSKAEHLAKTGQFGNIELWFDLILEAKKVNKAEFESILGRDISQLYSKAYAAVLPIHLAKGVALQG